MAGKIFKKRFSKRAVSPVISTVILTAAIIALLTVTLVFANGLLWSKVAEGDFNSAKQFMQTEGLQIDDVAWIVGRTQTTRYSSKYGEVALESSMLNYTVRVQTNGSGTYTLSNRTGVLFFNIPTSMYSVYNGYWQLIFPSKNDTLTMKGTSAPVARVFAVEKLDTGGYVRVVVAPAIRVLSSSINTSSSSTYYVKLYLPVLKLGEAPKLFQSVTLTGKSIVANTINNVTGLNVTVSFPRGSSPDYFNNSFFNFPPSLSEVISIPSGYTDVVVEFYVSEVTVDFGANP